MPAGETVTVGIDQLRECQVALCDLQLTQIQRFGLRGFQTMQHGPQDSPSGLGQGDTLVDHQPGDRLSLMVWHDVCLVGGKLEVLVTDDSLDGP